MQLARIGDIYLLIYTRMLKRVATPAREKITLEI